MMTNRGSRRSASAVLAFAIMAFASSSFAGAELPVATGDPGGSMMCKNCGPNANVQQKSGTASGGYANSNGDGTTNIGMGYTTPDDGTTYSGSASIVVTDGDGNLFQNVTAGITDNGNGGQMFTGLDNIYMPVGGSISISVNESNGRGGTFSATWNLRNFQP